MIWEKMLGEHTSLRARQKEECQQQQRRRGGVFHGLSFAADTKWPRIISVFGSIIYPSLAEHSENIFRSLQRERVFILFFQKHAILLLN